jgi:hypothetical protein
VGRFLLILGSFVATWGCLAAIVRGLISVHNMLDRQRAVTPETVMMLFESVYLFVINAALYVVFGRVMQMGSKPAKTTNVDGAPNHPRTSAG